MSTIAKNLLIGTLYYLFGRLGMLMSSDPVMATLFWPGAGVVMAAVYVGGYRLLPGVYIGAAVLNFSAVYSYDPTILLELPIIRILLMGLPPTLQALVAAYLARRFLGPLSRLETLREVWIFSVTTGPMSCLISPSLGVLILYCYGLTSFAALPLSWATWYVGDMLGVLVFAPVCVIFFNGAISYRRKILVTVPLISIFILVIGAFFYAVAHEKHTRMSELRMDSNLIALTLKNDLHESVRHLASIRSFFYASDFVSASEFDLFLKGVFSEDPAVRGVYWAPRVAKSDLKTFEREASQDKGVEFQVLEMAGSGQGVRAGERDIYFPILYASQRSGSGDLIGLDFAFQDDVKEIVERGTRGRDVRSLRDAGFFAVEGEASIILFLPVYDTPMIHGAGGVPKGFVIGVFSQEAMLKDIHSAWGEKGIEIQILAEEEVGPFQEGEDHKLSFRKEFQGLSYKNPFSIADENWVLSFTQSRQFLEGRANWGMWYVLAGSFLFTYIASGFLLIVTGHSAVTEAIVNEKTLQLKDQTHFLKVIMDNVPDMVFVKNEQHEIIAANRAFLNLYSPEYQAKIIGTTALEIFTPEEQELFKMQDRLAFLKGYTEVFESNTDYLGVKRTYFTRKIRFQDSEGAFLLLGIARDVSEILSAQAHLESILMATADGLLVIEEGGAITTFNKACEQIFGYSPDEILGKSISLLEPEGQAMEEGGNFLYFTTLPGVSGERKRQELWAKHKDGSVFPIYLAASHVKVGHVSFYCAIVRDISVEKKAQEDLRRSNQELEDFAYVASHDLKAPLRHLSLSANFLLRNYTEILDEKGQELLGIVRKSSERMFEMIDSLLAYSSVGRKDVEMSRINLEQIVTDVLEGMRSQIERSSSRIVVASLPEIYGNKGLMIQLFQNLIENAIKYRRKQSAVTVHISVVRAAKFWEISVSDDGIGIDPQYKEKIFKIFQRLHNDSEYHGTGIGLAICQRIVEFHGGSIRLDENCSEGSRFIIVLPAV